MIDTAALVKSQTKTEVPPSDKIFDELGKNTYDYKDVVSELIDNAVAARRPNQPIEVIVSLFLDAKGIPIRFQIWDNGIGIAEDRLGLAISPAALQSSNSLNEHGIGMKQAIASLGRLEYLATKTEGEKVARVVLKFSFGKIDTYNCNVDFQSGTEISVVDLKPIVNAHPGRITDNLVPYLGARYRRFLRSDNKLLSLRLELKDSKSNQVTNTWEVTDVKPIYFHPSTRTNKPVISNQLIAGDGWKASLTFGYAPTDEEYDELGLSPPNKFHPYYVSLSNQGLDVLLHDRIILFHQLSELGLVPARHNSFNNARGELDLLEGFSTAITKNSIVFEQHFKECIEQARDILSGEKEVAGTKKDYLKVKSYPEELPESLLRDRLANWLRNNPVNKKKDVKTEYVVQGLEGFIDILADGEAWELKVDQASGLDVYQLFMYMDLAGIKKGFLVAKDFTTGSKVAAEYVNKNHQRDIVLTPLTSFPINHPPDAKEREDYF